MADAAIVSRAIVAAPKDYTLGANEELSLKAVRALIDGSGAAGPFLPVLQIVAPDGTVMWQGFPFSSLAAGVSADVSWFPGLGIIAEVSSGIIAGVTAETLYLDSPVASVNTATVLASGVQYLVTVQGTYSIWNQVLDVGTPNADAMFPGSTVGRVSTQVGLDAETIFAWPHTTTHTAGHSSAFQINLGSGFSHVEPQGGPYSTAQPNYLYRYLVTGRGSTASFRIVDAPTTDNYGKLQIVVQTFGGSSSGGGGGGSLVPPTTADYATLQVVGGIPAWSNTIDGGSA